MRKLYLLLITLLFCASPMPAFAETYELTFQNMHPPTNIVQKVFKEWAEEVKTKSDGRLIIHIIDNASITTMPGCYSGVRDGTVDIGAFMPTYDPNELPYSVSMIMPYLTSSALDSLAFFFKAYETFPELKEELNRDVKFLAVTNSGHDAILSTKKQVLSPEEVKGQRVIVWSPDFAAEQVKAWGGNPLLVGVTDTYVGLQRGMGDYVFFQFPNARPLKLQELAKGVTLFYTANNPGIIAINKDVYASLPEDLQKILDETTGYGLSYKLTKALHDVVYSDMAEFEKEGIPITMLTDEQREPFKQAVLTGPAMDWWKTILNKAKMPNVDAWIEKVYALAAEPREKLE